jgi:hypothetical protein
MSKHILFMIGLSPKKMGLEELINEKQILTLHIDRKCLCKCVTILILFSKVKICIVKRENMIS